MKKKNVLLEYCGTFALRKADKKGRFLLPNEWIDETKQFFFVDSSDGLLLYPDYQWRKIMLSKKTIKEKGEWSKSSIPATMDQSGRLLLPKHCRWRRISLIGILDCVIIMESAL